MLHTKLDYHMCAQEASCRLAVPMGSSRDAEESKDTTDPPDTEGAQTGSMLPPRVVVQLPDGGVQIGEDSQRLQHEQQAQQASSSSNRPGASASSNRPGAQPGTEQWLELRRLLYATALEAIALKRRRISHLLVGTTPSSVQTKLFRVIRTCTRIALRAVPVAYAHQAYRSGTTAFVCAGIDLLYICLLYTSPSPRDRQKSRMPSSA